MFLTNNSEDSLVLLNLYQMPQWDCLSKISNLTSTLVNFCLLCVFVCFLVLSHWSFSDQPVLLTIFHIFSYQGQLCWFLRNNLFFVFFSLSLIFCRCFTLQGYSSSLNLLCNFIIPLSKLSLPSTIRFLEK